MTNKLELIDCFVQYSNLDILCVSEHWLHHNDIDIFCFSNYKVISQFSRAEHIHGGSLILVNNTVCANDLTLIRNLSVECHIELCGISYFIDSLKIVNICVYRPPNGDINIFTFNLAKALNIAMGISKNIILCGDFNIDYNKKCFNTNVLNDLINSFDLTVTLTESTRIYTNVNGYTSSSCIDYMITNLPPDTYSCHIMQPNLADHLAHFLNVKICKQQLQITQNTSLLTRRIVNENTINTFNHFLSHTDWSGIYCSNFANAFKFFVDNIVWCYEASCPLKKIALCDTYKNDSKAWVTQEVKQQSTYLKNLFWLMVNLNSPECKRKYDEEKKKYRNLIKIAKQNYYKNKINNSTNKNKETWKIVNKILDRNKNINKDNITLKVDNIVISDTEEVARAFGYHFSNVAPNKIKAHFGSNLSLPCTVTESNVKSMYFDTVTVEEVHSIILQLKNKSSSGHDGLTAKIIKNIKNNILEPFVYLINKSIVTGEFPDSLKIATVIPLLKKGDPTELDNYRQISLLSTLSKVIERVAYNRISDYVETNKILTICQHGFRANKSTETASWHLLKYAYQCLDEGQYVVSLLFDLSKAFDTVNKEILSQKLYSMGIRGNILTWLCSYMENRSLIVNLREKKSTLHNIELGVPQGSVLGPLLFMLYVNDLPRYMEHGQVTMFADDTTITVSANTPEELQLIAGEVVESLNVWCQRNKLILNENKTVYINFYLQRPLSENNMFNEDITLSDSVKLLGTFFDSKLSWYNHIEHVCNRLNGAYFAILQLKSTLDRAGLINVYYSMAYSHISYNILAWGRSSECERVFICQKRIIRLIFDMKAGVSCREIFKEKLILTTPCIYILKCLTFTKNNMGFFEKRGNSHNYATRHGDLLNIPRHNTSAFKKSPYYNCIILYNALPKEIRDISGYTQFRNKVKGYLSLNGFYSVNEFINGK